MIKYIVMVVLSLAAMVALPGCQPMAETAQKISDDLGDKVFQGHAFVDIWQVTPSDPASNSAPTGKKITIIGDIKSIPLTSKQGETVKDYAEYRRTRTPAWYNSNNVTEEESFVFTGDSAKDLAAWCKLRQEKLLLAQDIVTYVSSSTQEEAISYIDKLLGDGKINSGQAEQIKAAIPQGSDAVRKAVDKALAE